MFEPFATGGIARGRDAGYPAILHGTEAVVPLPNGNAIPVEMRGAAGSQNNVTVNVSVDSNGNASSNMQQDSQQAGNLGQVIARAVQQELQNQKRSGGILNPYGAA
jgi:phage-related minor tail protein